MVLRTLGKRGAQDRVSTKNDFSEWEEKIEIFPFSGTDKIKLN